MATFNIPNFGTVEECPYNRSHTVPVESMQKHLLKCRRQYPNAKLVPCHINRVHVVPEQELGLHMRHCPDRLMVESFAYTSAPERNDDPKPLYGTSDNLFVETITPTERAADDENWDEMDVPAYNPAAYCAKNPVMRKATHKTSAEKREFYESERIRMDQFKRQGC